MRDEQLLLAFNRGLMSKHALARIDLKRTALSAEIMKNWMPHTLGHMSLRPGTKYLGATHNGARSVMVPFVFATNDTAQIELTDSAMRVWIADALIERPVVGTTVAGGDFGSNNTLTGWTDADEAGATSSWDGYLSLLGTGSSSAVRDQAVSVAVADRNVEHALALYVLQGEVTLSIGSTLSGGEYVDKRVLTRGYHSVSFTPGSSGTVYVRLASSTTYPTRIVSALMDSPGPMVLTTPWGASDLPDLRWDQSGDVIFCCDGVHRQQRIERHSERSWSIVDYLTPDGPFLLGNTGPITLTPSALSGFITLTASAALFTAGHVGTLFRIASYGQTVSRTISGGDQWSDPIRVTGVGAARPFAVIVSGKTDASVVTLQRSVGAPGDWSPITTYSADGTYGYDDTLDNQIIYYRVGVYPGGWVSDTFDVSLTFSGGSIEGVARIVTVDSPTSAHAIVVKNFGGTGAATSWWEGRWSDVEGWPTAVALYEGRLWWAGHDKIDGSVSDAYASFDESVEGDSGPVSRNVASGPVDNINWLLPMSQLLVGTQGAEMSARASSLDEPLTPSAFSLRAVSTQGSAPVGALRLDTSGLFVQRNGTRIMELSIEDLQYTYKTNDLTVLTPAIGSPGVVKMVVQRQPDTRVHCIRSDGTVALMVYDRAENVNCWVELETNGIVVDAVVLPSDSADGEDAVYYVVKRTINGSDVHYLERWAAEVDAVGGTTTVLSDCSLSFAGPVTTVAGLDHLEGETVCVWGNGKDLGAYAVSGGRITLAEQATNVTVGLPYAATFKSARFTIQTQQGNVTLTHPQQITHVGLVLSDTHAQGLRYGQDLGHLDALPLVENGAEINPEGIWTDYDNDSVEVNGTWDRDARLYLVAASPRPCTVIACLVDVTGHAK